MFFAARLFRTFSQNIHCASHRTPVNFLLMNLAIADMAVAVFFAPRYLFIHSITHPEGTAGLLLCKLLTSGNLAWVGAASSVVTLVSTAFERYYAVLHPHGTKGNLTENKVKVNSHPCFSKFIIKMMSFEKESIITVMKNRGGGGGVGGDSTRLYTGRHRPTSIPSLTFLYAILADGKGTPFVYLLVTNGTPSTYLV